MVLTPQQARELLEQRKQASSIISPERAREILAARSGQPAPNAPGSSGKIFSGGALSDILDVLQTPQFAATGLFSKDFTVGEAVKNRITPAQTIGTQNIKSPVLRGLAGFGADVLLDPLNIVGLGAATKAGTAAKAGVGGAKAATTLGAAARQGQRALFGITKPFSNELLFPIVRGEKVLEKATQAGEAIKRAPVIGKALETVGVRPSGTFNIDEIEKIQSGLKAERAQAAISRGVERNLAEEFFSKARNIKRESDDLIKRGVITKADYEDIVEKVANPNSKIKIKDSLQPIFKRVKEDIEGLNKRFKELGGPQLEGKVVKNVLVKEGREAAKDLKSFAGKFREVAGEAGSEQFAGKTNFRSLAGDVEFGQVPKGSKTKATLASGVKLQKLKAGADQPFVTTDVIDQLDEVRTRAAAEALDLPKSRRAAFVNDAVDAAEQRLRQESPNKFYERVAVSPRQANVELEALDEFARFSEDPAVILAAQARDVAKLQARKQYVEGVKNLPITVKVVGGKVPPGYKQLTIKGLENFAVPEIVAKQMDRTFKAFSSIEEVEEFVKGYDKLLNFWKGTATFINPAFHTRNAVSNAWQLFLAGVNPAKGGDYLTELKVRKGLRAGKPLDDILSGEELRLFKEYSEEMGLRSTGSFSVDIEKDVSKLQDNFVFEVGGAVGEWLENGAKYSLYKQLRNKGFGKAEAAAEVRKYLFDYSDLTPFERNFYKRIFPFYTWTRKNLPLQVSMLIQKPEKISVIAKARAAIEDTQGGESLDPKYIPEWLKEAYPVYLGEDNNGLQRFVKLEGFLPSVDLNRVFRLQELPEEMLSPIFKTPLELITNYDMFLEREIKEFKGDRDFLGLIPFTDIGVDVDPKIAKVARTFRPVGEIQKFVKDEARRVQPTPLAQFLNFFIGKSYQLDPTTNKQVFERIKASEISKARALLEEAKKRGRTNRQEAILELMKELEKGQGVSL